MFEAILCDMDGTLIDTEYANAAAYCESFKNNGIDIEIDEFIDKYAGMSWREFIPLVCPAIDSSASEKIAKDKKKIYKDKLSATKLKSNIITMVQALGEHKHVALVTTASREAVNDLLGYHKITDLFDLIITGDDVSMSKPHPEPYLLAASKLKVRIENCIVLEDSSIGIRSARAAGATVLIVDDE